MPEYLIDKKYTYSIDIKIYEPANISELPFSLPIKLNNNSILKLGYHHIVMIFTQEEFDNFCDQISKHGIVLKIIGTERLD